MGEIMYKLADGTFKREFTDDDWDVLVRAAMHRQGYTSITELCLAMDVSRQSWHKWARGVCRASPEQWQKLAVLAGFPRFQTKKAS